MAEKEESEVFKLLRGKLGAARIVLAAFPHLKERAGLSLGQANAFLDLFTKTGSGLDAEQRAQLQNLAVNAQFEGDHLTLILNALAGPAMKVEGAKRTPNQNFEHCIHYIDEKRWAILLSDAHATVKEEVLVTLFRTLGLHLPSEYTFKKLFCLLLMVVRSRDDIMRMTEAEKKGRTLAAQAELACERPEAFQAGAMGSGATRRPA